MLCACDLLTHTDGHALPFICNQCADTFSSSPESLSVMLQVYLGLMLSVSYDMLSLCNSLNVGHYFNVTIDSNSPLTVEAV